MSALVLWWRDERRPPGAIAVTPGTVFGTARQPDAAATAIGRRRSTVPSDLR